MRRALLPTLGLLFATLAMPVAAGLAASGAEGTGLLLTSQSAQLVLPQALGQLPSFAVDGRSWDVDIVAEAVESTLEKPFQQGEYLHADHRSEDSSFTLPSGGQMTVDEVTEADALLLVRPISGDFSFRVVEKGAYSVSALDAKVLEASHAWGKTVPPSPRYYEYVVQDTLELMLQGKKEVSITGDFQIYAWGVDLVFSDDGAVRQVSTGHTADAQHADQAWLSRSERFAHAIVTVHDGSLAYSGNSAIALYGTDFQAQALGSIEFQDAEGSVPAQDGEYVVAGTAAVEGGTYEWSHSGDGVGVRFLDASRGVKGDSVSFQPAPLVERSWFVPVALAVALLAVALVAYLAPAVAGRRSADAAPGLAGLRAAGFSRWASVADTGGRPRLAAFWAGRAHRILPHDPHVALARAIYLSQMGRFARALGLHAAAHEGFRLGHDLDQMGHNAYQAAKTALRSGRPVEALDWLRVAAESEPVLASDLAQDPAFAKLRSHPDYLSLVGPAQGLVTP